MQSPKTKNEFHPLKSRRREQPGVVGACEVDLPEGVVADIDDGVVVEIGAAGAGTRGRLHGHKCPGRAGAEFTLVPL